MPTCCSAFCDMMQQQCGGVRARWDMGGATPHLAMRRGTFMEVRGVERGMAHEVPARSAATMEDLRCQLEKKI